MVILESLLVRFESLWFRFFCFFLVVIFCMIFFIRVIVVEFVLVFELIRDGVFNMDL